MATESVPKPLLTAFLWELRQSTTFTIVMNLPSIVNLYVLQTPRQLFSTLLPFQLILRRNCLPSHYFLYLFFLSFSLSQIPQSYFTKILIKILVVFFFLQKELILFYKYVCFVHTFVCTSYLCLGGQVRRYLISYNWAETIVSHSVSGNYPESPVKAVSVLN